MESFLFSKVNLLLLILGSIATGSTAFQPVFLCPRPARDQAIHSPLFRSQGRMYEEPVTLKASLGIITSQVISHAGDQTHHLNRSRGIRSVACTVSARIRHRLSIFRRRALAFAMAFALVLSTRAGVASAVSGGRSGGSFGSKTRAPISRPMSRPSSGYRPRSSSPMRPSIVIHSGPRYSMSTTQWSMGATTRPVNRLTPSEITVLTATGGVLLYGYLNNKDRLKNGPDSPLGPGATMASVTVALNVPDRDDPSSITHSLRRISLRSDTSSRKGVQDLISEVALELLRQEKSFDSAYAESQHFYSTGLADRAFQAKSIRSRSKFDRELVNKFGGQNRPDEAIMEDSLESGKATKAVVTLNLAIEGDSTALPYVSNRQDLLDVLSRIASDAQVEECLLSGEVLWAPEGPGEILTNNDLYESYPDLVPL